MQSCIETDSQTDRQTASQTDRQTDRQPDRQPDSQTASRNNFFLFRKLKHVSPESRNHSFSPLRKVLICTTYKEIYKKAAFRPQGVFVCFL
jgi:hypothetical protein